MVTSVISGSVAVVTTSVVVSTVASVTGSFLCQVSQVQVMAISDMVSSLAASSTAAAGGAAAGAAGGGAAAGGAGGAGAGGAEAAGGAAGAGAGPLISMINQVQFMAICGRVGGEEADEGTSSFSAGLDWVNFSPPFEIVGGGDDSGGRRAGPSSCDVATCGLCVGKKLLEKLIVCAAVLALMFSLRWMCCTLYMRNYPEEPKPPDMSYPNWY